MRSGIDHCELEFGAGDDFTVDRAGGGGLSDGPAEVVDLGVDEEGVSRDDGLAEFDFVGAEEVANFSLVVRHAHDEDRGGLGHCFQLKNTGHDGVSGEVALEEFLVHGEVLDCGAFHLRGEAGDAVDEEEGVTVGKNSEDVLDVENGLGFGKLDRRHHGAHGGIVFLKGLGGFGVGTVAGLDGDDVAVEFAAGKHEIADEVECFVAGEFVVEAHGLLGHDFVSADDDGVFERASFDQALVEEGLDVFVEGEGAGGGDFLFVNLRGDDGGEVLHEAPVFTDVGDRDPELFVGDNGDEASVSGFEMDRLANFPNFTGNGLFLETGFINKLDEGGGGAVANRRFVGVHFDQGIIDPHAHEGREDVFDSVYPDRAFGEGRGALNRLHFGDVGIDERFVGEIDAAESEAMAFRCGL